MKVMISKDMAEEVIKEFEAENPGKSFYEMSSAEFVERMMEKIKITALPLADRGTP
jgi:hypothetical protein